MDEEKKRLLARLLGKTGVFGGKNCFTIKIKTEK